MVLNETNLSELFYVIKFQITHLKYYKSHSIHSQSHFHSPTKSDTSKINCKSNIKEVKKHKSSWKQFPTIAKEIRLKPSL